MARRYSALLLLVSPKPNAALPARLGHHKQQFSRCLCLGRSHGLDQVAYQQGVIAAGALTSEHLRSLVPIAGLCQPLQAPQQSLCYRNTTRTLAASFPQTPCLSRTQSSCMPSGRILQRARLCVKFQDAPVCMPREKSSFTQSPDSVDDSDLIVIGVTAPLLMNFSGQSR